MTAVTAVKANTHQPGCVTSFALGMRPSFVQKPKPSKLCTYQADFGNRKRSRTSGLIVRADVAHAVAPARSPSVERFDFLVIGSGIAGLSYALKVAPYGRVAIITKADAAEGCTRYAQGGICAVLDPSDSVESHVNDTLVAGAYLNDIDAVRAVCSEGPKLVLELAEFGARFTRSKTSGDLHLTKEGGHSARRIVHAADATGAEIERALLAAAESNSNIVFYEHHLAVDLLIGESGVDGQRYALGVDVMDQRAGGVMTRFLSPVTMLASGGAGQLYPMTTNPGVATGDGMAMAHRVNAAVANLEFVQFHPTALVSSRCPFPLASTPGACPAFLISEAVRGEGGHLYTADGGRRFMPRLDPRAELAPRDVVARAIHFEMERSGNNHVLLDITHKPKHQVLSHFPTIAARCESVGIDITSQPIPVAPAQHYMCGGVQTGLAGETSIRGLFACGEVACSGLHGANRLASNSLLEGLVFAERAAVPSILHAEQALQLAGRAMTVAAGDALSFAKSGMRVVRPLPAAASAWVAARRSELQSTMWSAAGIVRRSDTMLHAFTWVQKLQAEVEDLSLAHGPSTELIELRNLATMGGLVLSSALSRKESRGGHYCLDFPEPIPAECRSTVIAAPVKKSNAQPLSIGKGSKRALSLTRSYEL